MFGGAGHDVLLGDNGDDTLWGQDDNDTTNGGVGIDTINGGAGNDVMDGGAGIAGNDTFRWLRADIVDGNGVWAGFDTILDFGAGDRLDFSGILGGAPPFPLADLIRVTDTLAGTIVSLDLDANGHYFDVAIHNGVHAVDAHDLLQQYVVVT